jgi:radical S-adenosyl methionine domain-containing protein 2
MNSKKTNKIVLSGLAGSGKSTVGKLLSEKLGWKFISMGEFSRNYARSNFNTDINTFQDYCKQNSMLDELLDKQFIQDCQSENNLIIDYRLGFHFVPNSFKICLHVSPIEAARRINMAKREYETKESIAIRNVKMINRFKEKYGIDFSDIRHYDLIIGTDFLSQENSK